MDKKKITNQTKKTLAIYWKFAWKYKFAVSAIIFSIIAGSLINVAIPLYYKDLFNNLTGSPDNSKIVSILFNALIMIGVLEFVQWIFWRIVTFTSAYFQLHTSKDLSQMCFNYLHKHSFSYFNNNFGGSLVKRVKWFTSAFEAICDETTWQLLPLIVNIAAIFFVLAKLNLWIGLGLVAWVFIFLAINWIFIRYKLKYDLLRSEAETATTALLADTITNHSNVKLFNGYNREVNNFGAVIEKLRKIRRFTWNLNSGFHAVQSFLMIILEVGIYYVAILLWQKKMLTLGDFVLIQSYLMNIFSRVWDFGNVLRRIYQNLADAEEMTVILQTEHEIKDAPKAKNLAVTAGRIEFKNVSFYYHNTRSIFKKFNLQISAGERLAVIGPSGAGKTTVVKLILRMHDIASGKILIDDQDIARVTQESLWQNISLVPQDPILFHRTLMENIRYGKPEATDEEVVVAAIAANCHQFIQETSHGYETFVGERGIKLSGGERQRIAIARAILRNAPILILDEATSSLDSHSEALIQEALDRLMAQKTVIVIAHRLSTIKKMDRIVVVDKGEVKEEGSHDYLIKKSQGIYKKLWELQAGGFIK